VGITIAALAVFKSSARSSGLVIAIAWAARRELRTPSKA
jgi:hypothetical protein